MELQLTTASLMSMLRAAYEMCDNTHMSSMKQLIFPYEIGLQQLKQLLGNLVLPSLNSEFVKELKSLEEMIIAKDAAPRFAGGGEWKSEFVYYATSMCHLFYTQHNPQTGLFLLKSDCKPVFYECANNPISYIWLSSDEHGMLSCVQSYFVTDHMPNLLNIAITRNTKQGELLPLLIEIPIGSSNTTAHKIMAFVKIAIRLDKRRLKLLGCDVIFLNRSFALLLSFGMIYNSLHMICMGECELKQLPVALHKINDSP